MTKVLSLVKKCRSGIRTEKNRAPGRPDRALLAIVVLLYFFTVHYSDINIVLQFGFTFLDSLFDGVPFSFYDNAMRAGVTAEGAVYDLGSYIIFGIWGLPVWLLNRLFHSAVSPVGTGSLLYFKLLPLLFLYGVLLRLEELADETGIGQTYRKWIPAMYIVSLIVFFPVFVAVQIDIIAVWFILGGIAECMRGNRRKYLFYFAVALSIKPFACFLLVLCVLWSEKRTLFIIRDVIAGASLMLIFKAMYLGSTVFHSNSAMVGKRFHFLTDAVLPSGQTGIPIFIFLLTLLWICAYLHPHLPEREREGRFLILLCYAVMGSYCIWTTLFPYWAVYFSPFVLLCCLSGGKETEQLLLLDFFGEGALTLVLIYEYYWVYGGSKTFAYLLLKGKWLGKFGGGEDAPTVGGILGHLGIETFLPSVYAIAVACFLSIGIVSWRRLKRQSAGGLKTPPADDGAMRTQFRLRLAVLGLWILGMLVILYTPNKYIALFEG